MCLHTAAGKSQRWQLQLTMCCHNTFVGCVHTFTSSSAQGTAVMLSPNSGLKLEQMAVTLSDLLLVFLEWRVCLGQNSHYFQRQHDFTLRVRVIILLVLRFLRKPCVPEPEPEIRAPIFPHNQKAKPECNTYNTWKSELSISFQYCEMHVKIQLITVLV